MRKVSEKDFRELVDKIMKKSFGQIEKCIVASEDGLPVVTNNSNTDSMDELLAAIASPLFAAIQEVLKQYSNVEIEKIDIKLSNDKHLIISSLGSNLLVILSANRPNLGLIYVLIDGAKNTKNR